jgi:CheY-like chemotaxis protein
VAVLFSLCKENIIVTLQITEHLWKATAMLYGKKATVLLIEGEASLCRLISLGMQDHGIYVIEARSPTTIPSFDTQLLDLVIVDADQGTHANWSFLDLLQSHTQLSTLPTIILTWDHSSARATSSSVSSFVAARTQTVLLTKPFDARALHQTIDQLLQVRAQQEKQRENLVEERLLATYTAHAAPSIWPVMTAIGLFMLVSGLLLQFVIAILGVFVVVFSLLLWTLGGAKPAPARLPMGV